MPGMPLTLSDADADMVADRVIDKLLSRLTTPPPQAPTPLPPPAPIPPPVPHKLAYTLKELSDELGISKASLYRFEARGLLIPLPYCRRKVFSREEVERFLAGQGGDPRPAAGAARRDSMPRRRAKGR